MSILHETPPQTQTSEQIPSGEFTDVAIRLGSDATRSALGAEILYLPTHDSLQAGIDYKREELAKFDASIQEVNNTIAGIDAELFSQWDRLAAIKESIDDLGLSGSHDSASKRFNGYSYDDVNQRIHALVEDRINLLVVRWDNEADRSKIVEEIEAIEQKDFELLQAGK